MKYSEYENIKRLINVAKNDYNNQMYFYNNIRSEIVNEKEFTSIVNDIISTYNSLCSKASSYSGRVSIESFTKLEKFVFEPLKEMPKEATEVDLKKIEESVYAKYI